VVSGRARRAGADPEGAVRQVRELQAPYEPAERSPLNSPAEETEMGYQERITLDAGRRGGKPCIRGLRITVYDVLEYLASGMSEDEILTDFPDLERGDVRACLTFAADRERRTNRIPA